MTRRYTGYDGDAKGRRAGTEKFVQLVVAQFPGVLWNNGTFMIRNKKNTVMPPQPSVHCTGRAADLSWRPNPQNGKGAGTYEVACQVIDWLVANAETLSVELVTDYYPRPFGRAWRCDRGWKVYDKATIGGAPYGDWIHVEIAPANADNPGFFVDAFNRIANGKVSPTPTPTPATSSVPYPGKPIKSGSRNKDAVKLVQHKVGVAADGKFGVVTENAVKSFQTSNGLTADGVVGPSTWRVMFG